MVPHLRREALAVDLPGRGRTPAQLCDVTLGAFAAHTANEISARDLREVVLVGHSMAGAVLPGIVQAIPERIDRLVWISCVVPDHGRSVLEALANPEIEAIATAAAADNAQPVGPLDPTLADVLFCNDMNDVERAWTIARLVPESARVTVEPVDLRGLRHPIPRSWVRLLQDQGVTPSMQDRFAATVGGCDVIDLDAGHMAMISRPAELAAILDDLAADNRVTGE